MNIITEKTEDGIKMNIEGRVDTVTGSALQEAILNAFKKTGSFVLDFEKVDYVSSAGLRALLIGEKTARGKRGSMKIIHVQEAVRAVFLMTGFLKILQIDQGCDRRQIDDEEAGS